MNNLILNILKRKISSGEITVDNIKITEYKTAIEEWQKTEVQNDTTGV